MSKACLIVSALILAGCADTVENYYTIAQPDKDAAVDGASTNPDAKQDVHIDALPDTTEPEQDAAQPDAYELPDAAVDTMPDEDTGAPDTYVEPVDATIEDTAAPVVDAGPQPYECPGGRHTVLEPVTAGCAADGNAALDGSGQVRDNTTGLIWNRKVAISKGGGGFTKAEAETYCKKNSKRLAASWEVYKITGDLDTCAFPCHWATWVSDGSQIVWDNAYTYTASATHSNSVLCVK